MRTLFEILFKNREERPWRICRRGRHGIALAKQAFATVGNVEQYEDKVIVRTGTDSYVWQLVSVDDP